MLRQTEETAAFSDDELPDVSADADTDFFTDTLSAGEWVITKCACVCMVHVWAWCMAGVCVSLCNCQLKVKVFVPCLCKLLAINIVCFFIL